MESTDKCLARSDESWYANGVADELENVTILKLPPYSPEPNAIGQVWIWLRHAAWLTKVFSTTTISWSKFVRRGTGFYPAQKE